MSIPMGIIHREWSWIDVSVLKTDADFLADAENVHCAAGGQIAFEDFGRG